MNKKILIIAAHPDDEVLGCFGTVARLIKEGYEAYTLILGEGKTSRDTEKLDNELLVLNDEIIKANDNIDLLDIVKLITKVKDEIKPNSYKTHGR